MYVSTPPSLLPFRLGPKKQLKTPPSSIHEYDKFLSLTCVRAGQLRIGVSLVEGAKPTLLVKGEFPALIINIHYSYHFRNSKYLLCVDFEFS